MADVFISYASVDREHAERLAGVLAARGHSVWWDRTIPPGRVFDQVIQEELAAARCVIVLWSRTSVASNWVKAEASEGAARGYLIPVLLEPLSQPIEFKRIQAADLSRWNRSEDDPELTGLLNAVERMLRAPAAGKTAAIPAVSAGPGARRPRKTLLAWALVPVAAGGLLFAGWLLGTRSATAPENGSPGAPSPDRINLIADANGGHAVSASHQNWALMINGKEDGCGWIDTGEAIYAFEGGPARFDTFTVFIPSTSDANIGEFELQAGNHPDRLTSIGKFKPKTCGCSPLRTRSSGSRKPGASI